VVIAPNPTPVSNHTAQIASPQITAHSSGKTRVILVRHGRSSFNEQGRYQGSSNESVLTEKGRQTAQQTAQFLKEMAIDAIYASPLNRVKQTVYEMINATGDIWTNKSIQLVDDLREIEMYHWEGRPFQQVREQYPDDYQCWKERPHEFKMAPSDESQVFPVLDLYQRAQTFWQKILPQHLGQTLLIVSHGGTNHALLNTALGITAEHHHTIQQSNCGVSILEFEPQHPLAQLQAINLTQHLGETLPKVKEGKQGLRLILVPTPTGEAEVTAIAQALQSVAIDFSLNITGEPSSAMMQQILHTHPSTVQFQTRREDFAQAWQRSIAHQRQRLSLEMMTGLVITNSTNLIWLITQALQHRVDPMTNNNLLDRIHLQPGTFSVLHYPSAVHPPILQALNFGLRVGVESKK
jgi:probable phosphoglycerate mutase